MFLIFVGWSWCVVGHDIGGGVGVEWGYVFRAEKVVFIGWGKEGRRRRAGGGRTAQQKHRKERKDTEQNRKGQVAEREAGRFREGGRGKDGRKPEPNRARETP